MKNMLLNYLTWSQFRAQSILTCPRQYGYRHVQSWEGWLEDSTPDSRVAYQLNQIIPDLRIETGNIVHDRAGRILHRIASGMEIDLVKDIAIAEEDFDRFVKDSPRLSLAQLGKKRKKLLAHLLGRSVSEAFVESERASISVMLRNFLTLPEVVTITAHPDRLFRNLIEPPFGEPTNEIGVPARLVTDAVFLQDDATVVVCDWKTGKPRAEHRDQGIIYDIFVRSRLGLSESTRVEIRFLYLRQDERLHFEFNAEERLEARWKVGEDFALMAEKSSHPVLNEARLDSFPAHTGPHCFGCAHQVVCPDFNAAVGRGTLSRHGANREVQ